jgi:hypothetical protein
MNKTLLCCARFSEILNLKWIGLVFFCFMFTVNSHAAVNVISTKRTENVLANRTTYENIKDSVDKRFIEERQILENQADRQYGQLKDVFEWTVKGLGLLIALGCGVFFFFFGRNRKELRELVDDVLRKEIDKIVSQDIEPVRERLARLQSGVDQLLSFKDRRVVWVADTKDDIDATLSAFSNSGLSRIEVQTPEKATDVNVTGGDLVILSYDGTENAKQVLKKVVEQLKTRGHAVHLILHTYGDGSSVVRVDAEEMKLLASLKWFSMANFPSTMISQVVSLVHGAVGSLRE